MHSLLHESRMVSLEEMRPLLPIELLGIHTWPALLPSVHELASFFPCAELLDGQSGPALSPGCVANAVGNGMHLAAVGGAILLTCSGAQ